MTAGKSAPVANLRDAKKAQAQSRRTPGRKASASGQVGTGQSASREGRVQRDWTRRRSAPQHVGVGLDSRGRCPHCRSQTASRGYPGPTGTGPAHWRPKALDKSKARWCGDR